jgi:hypothetical protein
MPVGADPVALNWNALARKSVDAPLLALRGLLPSCVEDCAVTGALAATLLRCSCFGCFGGSMGITNAIAGLAYQRRRTCAHLTVIQRPSVTVAVLIHSQTAHHGEQREESCACSHCYSAAHHFFFRRYCVALFHKGNAAAKNTAVTVDQIKNIELRRVTGDAAEAVKEVTVAGSLWEKQPAIVYIVRRPGCPLWCVTLLCAALSCTTSVS